MFCVLYCVLCIVYCVLCIVYCVFFISGVLRMQCRFAAHGYDPGIVEMQHLVTVVRQELCEAETTDTDALTSLGTNS